MGRVTVEKGCNTTDNADISKQGDRDFPQRERRDMTNSSNQES